MESTFSILVKVHLMCLHKKMFYGYQKKFELPNQYNIEIKQKVGRPPKLFTESSLRSNQCQSIAIRKICTMLEITFIAKSKLYKSGKKTISLSIRRRCIYFKKSIENEESLKN